MSAAYSPLPTQAPNSNGNGYPPLPTKTLLSRLTPTAPPTRIRRLLLFVAVLALSSVLLVYLIIDSSFSSPFSLVPQHADGGAGYVYTDPGDPRSPFFRDTHPVLHSRLFLARARKEIRARRLDTCDGQLGTPMVDAYVAAALPYCTNDNELNANSSSITCFPVRAEGSRNAWWPYPQAFCASHNLAHTQGWGGDLPGRGLFTGTCAVTEKGVQLKTDMGTEGFLGTEFSETEGKDERTCGETIPHPVLFVPRQDRWNPFHVGEDLVTTFLALTLFSRHMAPSNSPWKGDFAALEEELAKTAGLQLVFQDSYLPTESLFAPLFDRIGAFPPRRTAAEALGEGGPTCFAEAFHSVGAGASLLSATRVGKEYYCASELVWGASLWLRWVWGLEGGALPGVPHSGHITRSGHIATSEQVASFDERPQVLERRARPDEWEGMAAPVQVLFLSRAKFDAYTKHKNNRLTMWQEARHITNEAALLTGLREGFAGLCRVRTDGGIKKDGTHACTYTDADALPMAWGMHVHPSEARALGLSVARSGGGAAGGGQEQTQTQGNATATTTEDGNDSEHHSAYSERRGDTDADDTRAQRRRATPQRALRFATLDPTTSALAAQLGAVGRADVVVSVHAGALGLSLFMPTGRASIVELVPPGASGNHHFHNMAHNLGMQYKRVDVAKTVDVPAVVRAVREIVEARLAG
ncbi:hypothetical protein C8R44DRAFT_138627 [Mycena epipterygia]|nr:hypothetical protein C8R44DRAFT_138627 [Mycena epipterygia]